MHFTPGFPVLGYSIGGVGWAFVPTSDLLVTGIASTAPQVSFWSETNQLIANYEYAGPFGNVFTGPSTNYQAISSLRLSAGHTYFISTQYSNLTSSVNWFAYGRNGVPELLPFETSPYISQFASYKLSPSGEWSSPTTPASENVNIVLLGPNFQFEPIPEPTSVELLTLALLVCWPLKLFHRGRNLFAPSRG